MGREMRRVPMDFDWPRSEVWKGYFNPLHDEVKDCPSCAYPSGGLGLNKKTAQLSRNFYDHSSESGKGWRDKITQEEVDYLLSEDRLRTFVDGKWQNLPITADEVNTEQKNFMGGHDAINRMYLIEFRAKKLGIWGPCDICEGHGSIYPEGYDHDYEWVEPPTGEGFQMWETTSEGSPASPVFASIDELAEWCATNASTFASVKASKADWLKMFNDEFVHHKAGNNIFF